MAVETFFLVVLVVALVIGNILLGFFPSSKKGQIVILGQGSNPQSTARVQNSVQTTEVFSPGAADAFNQKILLVARQLALLNQKVSKLENATANNRVEMKGIMEILGELQEKNLTVKAKKFSKKPKEKDLSTKEMHKIIYRSRKK